MSDTIFSTYNNHRTGREWFRQHFFIPSSFQKEHIESQPKDTKIQNSLEAVATGKQ
jgi:hypothetical protein